ncbi:MAG: DUF4148 domain-containing protein [Polaromonas sp.]|uniref:DUF4148 domain-containing protein n=1 Tax=Polaromonas sp. TaxID=1869339 RepID=UPI00248A1EAF|nr:DUF4148 domain-containing protein [Polaromonas sp.]MDI1268100.1 DUF4148 domain-containing protein [Polaromonas sp.]
MSTQKLALIAAFAVLSGASLAVSAEIIHPADTEMGYVSHPDHAKPGKSRAEVRTELEAAMKSPRWDFWARLGAPMPAPSIGPGKSRDQVRNEAIAANRAGLIPRGEFSY